MRASSFYAIDLEFVKCRSRHFCRAIAFVPFHSTRGTTVSTAACTALTTSAACDADDGARQYEQANGKQAITRFPRPPTVISLRPTEVMRSADVLPCGHVLLPLLSERLVQGDALAELKGRFQAEAAAELAAYRAMRQSLREFNRAAKEIDAAGQPRPADLPTTQTGDAGPEAEAASHTAPSPSASPLPSSTRNALSPQEALLRKELQIRLAITEHFELLDPFSIPNVRRLSDLALLARLVDSDATSACFASAMSYLQPLRAYGRGRGGRKALSFLLRYHPAFAQAVLRRSFESGRDFTRFLEACAAASDAALTEVQRVHRGGASPRPVAAAAGDGPQPSPPFASLSDASTPAEAEAAGVNYVECDSLESFSLAINETWSRLLHCQRAGKFFAYGNADARVLHTTLALGCATLASDKLHFSPRADAAGRLTFHPRTRKTASPPPPQQQQQRRPLGASVDAVRSDLLLSPYQARVLDVTSHPLFAASGYVPQEKRVPPLAVALQRAAAQDATAAALRAAQRPHDPLWDAQALACVCVGAGVVR